MPYKNGDLYLLVIKEGVVLLTLGCYSSRVMALCIALPATLFNGILLVFTTCTHDLVRFANIVLFCSTFCCIAPVTCILWLLAFQLLACHVMSSMGAIRARDCAQQYCLPFCAWCAWFPHALMASLALFWFALAVSIIAYTFGGA